MNDRLLKPEEVAEYLGVCTRQVVERYAPMPDFPKAVVLPSPSKAKAHRRWLQSDIENWIRSLQK